MKLSINIEFTDGTKETFIAQPPEFVKWEAKSGFTVQQAGEKMGITDFQQKYLKLKIVISALR